MTQVVVFGNEKGGASKTTSAWHFAIACCYRGLRVATIDLDYRQRSFSRWHENRTKWCQSKGVFRPMPGLRNWDGSDATNIHLREMRDIGGLTQGIEELAAGYDLIIIDCPGADTQGAQFAHATADLLVTAMAPSMMESDLLAKFDQDTRSYSGPSVYAMRVQTARRTQKECDIAIMRWLVMLNRYHPSADPEKLDAVAHLDVLGKRLSFTRVTGIAERTIYRDLFSTGRTALDIEAKTDSAKGQTIARSRAEINRMVDALLANLKQLETAP
ncbi:MAG: division plane positioning ATPase MipZ [Neomegalonema sp.]|nr:division plane positioning ATPase MipZ [Neomegalonema sp.]